MTDWDAPGSPCHALNVSPEVPCDFNGRPFDQATDQGEILFKGIFKGIPILFLLPF